MKMKKYSLELTIYLSGAIVMMLELTGSKILAPFAGAFNDERNARNKN
jgi:hypothetical protein